MFQGRLVGRTFLEHVQVINSIEKAHRARERPVGALALAVQAVRNITLVLSITPCDCLLTTL
jgi:hypothetical protein